MHRKCYEFSLYSTNNTDQGIYVNFVLIFHCLNIGDLCMRSTDLMDFFQGNALFANVPILIKNLLL